MNLLGSVGQLYMFFLLMLLFLGSGFAIWRFINFLMERSTLKQGSGNATKTNEQTKSVIGNKIREVKIKGGFIMANNGWIKLAIFSFVGLLVSIAVLGLVSTNSPNGMNNNMDMQSGTNVNTSMGNMQAQGNANTPMGNMQAQGNMNGGIAQNNNSVQQQINQIQQQLNQIQQQLNNGGVNGNAQMQQTGGMNNMPQNNGGMNNMQPNNSNMSYMPQNNGGMNNMQPNNSNMSYMPQNNGSMYNMPQNNNMQQNSGSSGSSSMSGMPMM